MKKLVTIFVILAMALSLTACGEKKDHMHTLVQGNLDSIYKGKASAEYLDVIDSTPEEAKESYLAGLDTEAEFFCYYFDVISYAYDETYEEHVRDETKARIVDMYKQIYDKSKYEVKESVKQSDGSYTVQTIIYPIDIIEQAIDKIYSGYYPPLEEFNDKYNIETDTLSDDELNKLIDDYIDDYANIIIDCIIDLLPKLGYKDAKTISVQVQPDADGIFAINDDDFNKIDDYMIYYP